MVNKKFQIKWRSEFCHNDMVITFSNMHEFAGALRAIIEDDSLMLIDVTTYEHYEDVSRPYPPRPLD